MNEVKIVVTGAYRPSGAVAALKKDLADLAKYATELEKAAKKASTEVDTGMKKAGNSADMAKEALQKLGQETDKAFDGLKEKMEKAFKAAEEERSIKVRAELDKDRFKSSLDGLGGFDFDITSGIGPKIAAAFGKVTDSIGKGVDLTKAGLKGAASFVAGLGEGVKAQHPAVQAAIYGTLITAVGMAAPVVGGVLAGGIVAGFGAGIGALGVVAAAQNGKVREAFSDMWTGVVADTQARAGVIEAVLIRTAGRAQTAWEQTGHMLSGAFSRIAPGLESLMDGLIRSIQRFAPALEPMASAASAVFKDLGNRLPDIMGELADSFSSLAESVEANPEALGDFIEFLGDVVEAGLLVVETLNNMYEANKKLFDILTTPLEWVGLKNTGEEVGKVGGALLKVSQIPSGPMASLKQAIAAIGEAGGDSAKKVDAVRIALDLISGETPGYTESLAAAAEAVGKLDGAFKEAKDRAGGFGKTLLDQSGAFDVTNENGRKLYQQVTDTKDAFSGMAQAVADGQMSREQFINDTNRMRDRLNDTWRQAGLNKDQIAALNYQYGLTPDQLSTFVRLVGAEDAKQALDRIARAREAVIYIRQQVSTYGGYVGTGANGQQVFHDRPSAHGGVVSAFAHGGVVSKAAAGGVRRSNVIVNDWGSQSHGEAIRLPQGSTVIPASMTRSLNSRWGDEAGAGAAAAEMPAPVVNKTELTVNLTVTGPVGSSRELQEWLVRGLDELDRRGRLSSWGR